MSRDEAPPALEVRGLTKAFGSVHALRGVSFVLRRGEVLGLLGDNGAGKSTLVKCISGVLRPDEGAILVDGDEVQINGAQRARELGIETVYQDLALVNTLDVSANLFLNREAPSRNRLLRLLGWVDDKRMRQESEQILEAIGVKIPSVRRPVSYLSGGQRQAISVGRAVGWGRHIVLMDEPAAALGVEQSRHVLDTVRRLRSAGVAVLFISHNMQHVMEVCERAVVLFHGRKAGEVSIADVTTRDLVDLITGAVVAD
jgi:ABC-type sugar transport system ATPase subunit